MKKLWQAPAVQAILLPWAVIFLILHLINTQDGGPNATSRFLTLRAMDEELSFRIDKRIGATSDWSQTPDGHYFSNKAPGPMLLGFPAFFLIDQIPRIWEHGYRDENGYRHYPGYFQKTLTSYLNQMIPLIVLLALIIIWMNELGMGVQAQTFFILAAMFGSTASLYFNNYSGHGMEAILQLATLYFLLRRRFALSGFFAGCALLSDYGFGMQIPAYALALLIVMIQDKKFLSPVKNILIGGIVPGILWCWYHISCYGGPFLIANNFQNPVFQDTLQEKLNLWGIFRIPSLSVLYELTLGSKRGILVTQPWVLLCVVLGFFFLFGIGRKQHKNATNTAIKDIRLISSIFCIFSLAALLLMNMSYGGWHGGGTAGPRYLSGIFLCFALWASFELDQWNKWIRWSLLLTLGISLLYRGIVYGSTILAPNLPLWHWYYTEFARPSLTAESRLFVYCVLFAAAFFWQKKRMKKFMKP